MKRTRAAERPVEAEDAMTEKQLEALVIALRALVSVLSGQSLAPVLDALRAVEEEERERKAADNMAEVK